jgi:glycosyltransferase involved in cell wall biosynthesis
VRRPKVLYIVFHAQPGGAELYLVSLLETLDRSRFEPIVAIGESGPLVERIRGLGVRVDRVAMRHLIRGARHPVRAARNLAGYATALGELARSCRHDGVDLVHAVDEPALKYAGVLARMIGARAVGTLPDALLPPYGRLHRAGIAWNARLLFDLLIVPSEANRRLALAAGLAPEHVLTLHTGVDVDRFATARARGPALRESLGIAPDAPLLGAVGRFDPLKGHDVLVRAMSAVVRRSPAARCVIVGDAVFPGEAEWRAEVERSIRAAGLAEKVVLAGWQEDVVPYLGAFDLLVHPSTRHDSLPTSVLEAMAAGCPVVGSRDGGLPELVDEGRTGWLVPPRDPEALAGAVLGALADPARLRAAGRAAAERAQRFDRRAHAARIAAIYDGVLAGAPSAGASRRGAGAEERPR